MPRCKHLEVVLVADGEHDKVQWCQDCGATRMYSRGNYCLLGHEEIPDYKPGKWKYPSYETMKDRAYEVQHAYYGRALDTAALPKTPQNVSFLSWCQGVAEGLNKAYKVISNSASVRSLKDAD